MQHFCFPDLGEEKLWNILVFGNVCFNIVVRINHDNVASRGAVGRTHTIVRLQTRIRRKDGTENSGGFVYVFDGFPQRDFVLWVFMRPIIFCVSFPALTARATTPHRLSFPAITPRATTPHLYHTGYHAQGYHAFTNTARLPRLCIYPGHHAIVLSSIPGLSHLSYHAPPHTYIGLSHPP